MNEWQVLCFHWWQWKLACLPLGCSHPGLNLPDSTPCCCPSPILHSHNVVYWACHLSFQESLKGCAFNSTWGFNQMLTWLMTAGKFGPRSQHVAVFLGRRFKNPWSPSPLAHSIVRAGSSPSISCQEPWLWPLSPGCSNKTWALHSPLPSPFDQGSSFKSTAPWAACCHCAEEPQ